MKPETHQMQVVLLLIILSKWFVAGKKFRFSGPTDIHLVDSNLLFHLFDSMQSPRMLPEFFLMDL
jgi:hypothetical protein